MAIIIGGISFTLQKLNVTKMAHDISKGGDSTYSQVDRFGGLFTEALKQPTPASLVADAMLEIANSDSWQLRYLIGPTAASFLGFRASMSDEQ